jgi:NADH-quinone oxidoreductase subunit F
MEFIPHLLIEGMITSSYALGANLSYIYIRGEYMWVYKMTINEAKAAGFFGKIY